MISGVGIFGVVAASAAAWFVSDGEEQHGRLQADAITAQTAEVTDLRQTVCELCEQFSNQPTRWSKA